MLLHIDQLTHTHTHKHKLAAWSGVVFCWPHGRAAARSHAMQLVELLVELVLVELVVQRLS